MDRDWARLGATMEAARRRLGWTQDELARAAGIGLSTVQSVERGRRDKPQILPTHRVLARAVGWTDDSLEEVLAGGEPTLAQGSEQAAPPPAAESRIDPGVDALLDDLTARVKDALLGGQVVDATAIDLGPDDEGGVVIIWKQGEGKDLTPDQQRKLRRRWARLQRAAHEILDDEDSAE